ncbi:MAG: LuxR family transcriptional regulator [Bacteroidetes bacterium]|nr:MAG: LuxR family transcriptional regulator [Bacteroidota bacterium]
MDVKALEPLLLLEKLDKRQNGSNEPELIERLQEVADLFAGFVYVMELSTGRLRFHSRTLKAFLRSPHSKARIARKSWIPAYVHPDDQQMFRRDLPRYFAQHPTAAYHAFYRLRFQGHMWRWVAGSFRLVLTEEATPYLMAWGFDAHQLNPSHQKLDKYLDELNFIKENCRKFEALTPRERQVLKLINEQRTNQEIANELSISKQTVQTHRKNVIKKLEVSNSIGLARYARFFEKQPSE